ncbi:MAG: universal stress protein [Nitrospirae bacterium]|nr:universal stress protein [Nitrospirota bacterium]
MGIYRKILVAIDGSSSSLNALRQAIRLACTEGCWITAVSVVPPYDGDLNLTGVGNIKKALREPMEKALSMAAEIANSERAALKTVCEEGEPHEKIVDLAEGENFGLIVMGRRGLHPIERALIGSVAARVIGYSQTDILIVPDHTDTGWKNILLTTDGSSYSNAARDKAINFAKTYGGELKVISVVDVPSEFYAEAPKAVEDLIRKAKGFVADVKNIAEASGIKTSTFVGEGDAYRVITDLAKKEKADIIFTGSHGRTGIKRLLMGSVTEKVIGYAPCPVLIVKP